MVGVALLENLGWMHGVPYGERTTILPAWPGARHVAPWAGHVARAPTSIVLALRGTVLVRTSSKQRSHLHTNTGEGPAFARPRTQQRAMDPRATANDRSGRVARLGAAR